MLRRRFKSSWIHIWDKLEQDKSIVYFFIYRLPKVEIDVSDNDHENVEGSTIDKNVDVEVFRVM